MKEITLTVERDEGSGRYVTSWDALRSKGGLSPPPQPERMPKVWEAWHRFPKDYDCSLRISCLQNGRLLPDKSKSRGKVCWKCSPEDFPLLWKAAWWCRFRNDWLSRINGKDQKLVKEWLGFRDLTAMDLNLVAAFRLAKELDETHKGQWKIERPSFAFIQEVTQRWTAYYEARRAARNQLNKLLLPNALNDPIHLAPPHHKFVAALHAHAIIHRDSLAYFFEDQFWKLKPAQAKEMLELYQQPLRPKDTYGALAVWLVDNRPIWQKFGWAWKDIHEELEKSERFERIPPTEKALKDYANHHRITPLINPGGKTMEEFQFPGMALLTPAPQVSLKPAKQTRRRKSA